MQGIETSKISWIEKNTTFFLPLIMLTVDYFAVIFAEQAAFFTREWIPFHVGVLRISGVNLWITIPFVFLTFFHVGNLYKRQAQFWQIVPNILYACNYAVLAIIVLMYVARITENNSRIFIVLLWAYSFIFVTLLHYFLRKLFCRFNFLQIPVLIVGCGNNAASLVKGIVDEYGIGYKIIGIVGDVYPMAEMLERYQHLGGLDDIERVIKVTGVKDVIIALSGVEQKNIKTIIYKTQRLTKNVTVVPDFADMPVIGVEVENLFNEKLLLLGVKNNLARPFNRMIKNIFDYVLTVLGTIAISPILFIIAMWIYKEDPGPIIFKHMRVGRGGKLFPCYKFRSMVTNSQDVLEQLLAKDSEAKKEWEANFKLKNDPRITKIGAFLRKTSLDELPQIFNVLKGEMSLVGPRPIIQQELDNYYKGYEEDYLIMKPGITGMWQVSGRSDTDYDERVELDRWYTRNWSIWLDFMILYKTIAVVLLRKGAY